MRTKLLLIALALTLIATGCAQQQSSDTIKIGLVAPITGDIADWGNSLLSAVRLAVEEANSEGGINGKTIELIVEDGKCRGKEAASATNKLLNIDNVDALTGYLCSSEMLGAAPIAEESKTILVGTGSSPDITDAGDYIFRTWPSDAGQAEMMADYLYDEGFREVAVIYTNSDYNLALADAFRENFEELGGEVTARETYEQGSSDFRTQITKINEAGPEAIFMVTYSEGGILMRQIREAGLNIPMFGSDTSGGESVIEDAQGAAEGVIYGTAEFDEEADNTQIFIDKFERRYGEKPEPLVSAVIGYDAVQLLIEGMREVGTNSEALKEWLYNVERYEGVSGTFSIDENGDPIKSFQMFRIENGTPVEYNPEE